MTFSKRSIQRAISLATVLVILGVAGIPMRAVATTVPLTPTPAAGGGASGGEVTLELPPPDLPTANEQGYTFDLKTSLKANLDAVAREAPVYELKRASADLPSAQKMADGLRIGASVQDRGDGSFAATGNGELFVSTDLIQYFSGAQPDNGDLPADTEAVALAREWLRVSGLLPPDLGDGKVIGRIEDTKRVIVAFAPIEPVGVLSSIPGITVTMGPKGQVVESALRWANIVRGDVYQLMPGKQAWQLIQSGQAFLDTDLSSVNVEPGADVQGTATFSKVGIAYATSGPPGGKQYLQPVYVFSGKLKVKGADKSVPIKAYVPALANSGAPVGAVIAPLA